MLVGIQDEILRLHAMGWLAPLLADKTTKRNIIWATDAYRVLGAGYERTQEILPALITGAHSDVIKTRARKEMEQQSESARAAMRRCSHRSTYAAGWSRRRMPPMQQKIRRSEMPNSSCDGGGN